MAVSTISKTDRDTDLPPMSKEEYRELYERKLKHYIHPGPPLTPEEFDEMVRASDASGTMTLEEVKKYWDKRLVHEE